MTQEEAIKLAQDVARKEDWAWLEPVRVTFKRKFIFWDAFYWDGKTNFESRGANIWLQIDDETATVIKKAHLPR